MKPAVNIADARLRLGVNVDHVATLRNARGGPHPQPCRAAEIALAAGADGVTAHLREDRRHIRDADLGDLTRLAQRTGTPLNLEMAVTDEMIAIALRHRPRAICLVPERREERTTEGGLDVAGQREAIAAAVGRLRGEGGARVSLFIEPSASQVGAAAAVGAQVVELHTGAFCDAWRAEDAVATELQLERLVAAAQAAAARGLEVHAGHGIDFDTVAAIAAVGQIVELNIGHFLIGESLFLGLAAAVERMRGLMDAAR